MAERKKEMDSEGNTVPAECLVSLLLYKFVYLQILPYPFEKKKIVTELDFTPVSMVSARCLSERST